LLIGKRGDVALDEIEFTQNKRCSPISELGSSVTTYCDFQTDTCGFQTTSTSLASFKWERARPEVLSFLEQPSKDNTLQTKDGYYMRLRVVYLKFFLIKKIKICLLIQMIILLKQSFSFNALTARLISPAYDSQNNGKCLNFYIFS
jgi:hypothetical protein